MLESLQEACKEKNLSGPQLLEYWHDLMEPTVARDPRKAFFTKVVKRAESVSHCIFFQLRVLIILTAEIEGGRLTSQSHQGKGRQADTPRFRSFYNVSQDLRALRPGGYRETYGISFRCSSRENDVHNVLRRSTGTGYALLDPPAPFAASAIVNKNVVRLHGNEIEHLLLCSSSRQESVSRFACLHVPDRSYSAFFATPSGVGSTITTLYRSWL